MHTLKYHVKVSSIKMNVISMLTFYLIYENFLKIKIYSETISNSTPFSLNNPLNSKDQSTNTVYGEADL